jgi:hypothetical protein
MPSAHPLPGEPAQGLGALRACKARLIAIDCENRGDVDVGCAVAFDSVTCAGAAWAPFGAENGGASMLRVNIAVSLGDVSKIAT